VADPFTLRDLTLIAPIVQAAEGNRRVRWLDPEDQDGPVYGGVARSLGDANFGFAKPTDDVRDLYLRVTTDRGGEVALKVRDLMALVDRGMFALGG
jgi:hypothetical protein